MNDRQSSTGLETWLREACEAVLHFEHARRSMNITPEVDAATVREHLLRNYGRFEGAEPGALIDDVARMMREWNLHITHPRYFGLFNPGVVPPAVAGDLLVAAFNPQLAAWSHAPAANEIERFTLGWFAWRLGLPEGTQAHFTSGGAEANHTAVVVALCARLAGWVERGACALERRPVVYASLESHHSFDKILRSVGLGRQSLRLVDVDEDLRIDIESLEAQIRADFEAGEQPLVVVGTAGTTGAGVVDPLRELAQLCARHGLWFHVDAAWGGAACLSQRLRPVLDGIEQADSVTWDAHKYLSVPMGAGMFFCRQPEAIDLAFGARTPYMPIPTEDTYDPYSSSLQWSRRNIGLKVFLAMAALGQRGYEELIDRQADIAEELRDALRERGCRICNRTRLPLVCFTHPRIERGEIAVADVIRAVERENFWISSIRLAGGDPVLRACITSYETSVEDVQALAAAVDQAVR